MVEFRKMKMTAAVVMIAALAWASGVSVAQDYDNSDKSNEFKPRKKDNRGNKTGEFTPGSFMCLNYINGLGPNSTMRTQTNIAQLWMLGYLAGYYKASGKLEVTDNKDEEKTLADLFEKQCRQSPENSILAVVSLGIVPAVYKLPKSLMIGLTPTEYTCAQHVDGRSGAAGDANKADLAELWAFAFVQGYKNVAQPGMEIAPEFKPAVIGAINKNCGTNRAMPFIDMASLIAEKVKMQ